jgi:hypothetical protein
VENPIKEVKKIVLTPQNMHPLKYLLRAFHKNPRFYIASLIWSIVTTVVGLFFFFQLQVKYNAEQVKTETLNLQIAKIEKSLETIKGRDEYKINESLKQQFKENHDLLQSTISVYEVLTDLPATDKKLVEFRTRFALVLKYLSDKNNSSASSELKKLGEDVEVEKKAQIASISTAPNVASAPVSNTPPGSGFSRQTVDVNGNKYLVDIVAGNLGNTRIIVDTATDGDCRDNCPVLSLGEYIARNGAYAGINGSYFCPADYPTCVGKSNSFDTLAMNKNKKYINSDNNIYSTVPAAIFGNGFMRFVGASQDWGRDTGVDGVLANQPLMVSGGKSVFGGDGDPKKGGSGTRGFVANKGNIAYIGFVHNASVANAALVLEKMGMDNALNLDSGGSVALWANGRYQVGPGRSIPNAILFINK